MLSRAFILLALAHFGNADDEGYTCPTQPIMINSPADLSQPVYFPSGWTESQPPATFQTNQKCMWKIAPIDGYYTQVVFYKKTDAGKDIYVEYPNSIIESLANDDTNPYIFPSYYSYIFMYQSNMSGAFSFKVQWIKYPDAPKNTVRVTPGNAPIVMKPNSNFTTFQADSRVALAAFSLLSGDKNYLYRRTAVFAGGSTAGEFIGTLYHVLVSSDQTVTVNDKLTVYTFDVQNFIDYPLFMAQDIQDCKNFKTIRGMNCPDTGDCSIEANPVYGPSLLVTAGGTSDYITGFDSLGADFTVKVYEGQISDKHLISSLTKETFQSQLPLQVNNNLKFYVLGDISIKMTLTKQMDYAKWNKVTNGRHGVLHSYNYGFDSNQQNANEKLTTSGNEQLCFNLAMKDVDLSHFSTILSVTVSSYGNIVYSEQFGGNHQALPPTVSACGDTLNLNYDTSGDYTNGYLINFDISKEMATGSSISTSTPMSSGTPPTQSTTSGVTGAPSIQTTTSSVSATSFFLITTGLALINL